MDRNIWLASTAAARSSDRRVARCGRRMRFSGQQIVRMYLWSVWHDRPLCWACDRDHYNPLFRPSQLPSVSQFCRWVKTPRVQAMLQAANDYLTRHSEPTRLSFLDGKPLPISFCSRDPDIRIWKSASTPSWAESSATCGARCFRSTACPTMSICSSATGATCRTRKCSSRSRAGPRSESTKRGRSAVTFHGRKAMADSP